MATKPTIRKNRLYFSITELEKKKAPPRWNGEAFRFRIHYGRETGLHAGNLHVHVLELDVAVFEHGFHHGVLTHAARENVFRELVEHEAL